MGLKNSFILLTIFISLLLLGGEGVLCWSNGGYSTNPVTPIYGTHDWIAEHALDFLPAHEKQYIVDNLAYYLYGTELPDNNQAADGIGDTTKHHIYYAASGDLVDNASAERASILYASALSFLQAHDYPNAAKTAGIMTHYIDDVAVFGHVMGVSTDWGAENSNTHSNYESYVDRRTESYNDVGFGTYLHFDGSLATVNACDAALAVAYDTTFGGNSGLNCTWMNLNYDWNNPDYCDRCGESLNVAVNAVADVLHTLYQEATPSASPTLSQSAMPSPSPTPILPELPAVLVLALMLTILASTIILKAVKRSLVKAGCPPISL